MRMEPRGSTVKRVSQFSLSPDTCKAGPFKGYERLHWINSAAMDERRPKCKSLLYLFSVNNLRQAFRQLDGNKAVGIDHVTKREYGKNLEANLTALSDEIQRGGWRPRPSREVLIPKANGGTRPLAIGCLEDKIVQLLMAKILEALFEPIFHRHSYGFRPGKSTHQALSRLYRVIRERQDNCVAVEMDIEKFFNSMDHEKLMTFVGNKVGDQHVLRLVRRMLRNSTLHQNGEITPTLRGSPQGAPVSPVLANIYLHYVLDEWFDEHWAEHGEIIRYADDAVFVFSDERQAAAFKSALSERLRDAGSLALNHDKSGMLRFNATTADRQLPFLGFCLYWGRSLKRTPLLKVKTAPKKIAKCIEAFQTWIKESRHKYRLDALWEMAKTKLLGHYQYYGVTFNGPKLRHFYYAAIGALFKWLNRRSQKRSFTWDRFSSRLLHKPLPKPNSSTALLDIICQLDSKLKHKPRSRMRKLRTSGSNRSAGWQQLAFT